MNKWNIQSEKDLWNEPVDWSSTYYSVILKNGQEQDVRTYADECDDGTINTYYEYVDDGSGVDFDDILLWKPVEKPEDCVSENLKKEAQKYADRITAELYRHSDKHYDKEKKCMTSVLYNVNWSEIGKAMEKCFIAGAQWADAHPDKQSIVKYLKGLGYTVTLNGDVITRDQEIKDMEQYVKYQKEKLIERTCKWLEGIAELTGCDSYALIETYKKSMKGE